jgi:hypothetical protein
VKTLSVKSGRPFQELCSRENVSFSNSFNSYSPFLGGKKQRDSGPQLFDMLVNELTKGELFREDLSRLSQKYPWKKKQVTSVQINA